MERKGPRDGQWKAVEGEGDLYFSPAFYRNSKPNKGKWHKKIFI